MSGLLALVALLAGEDGSLVTGQQAVSSQVVLTVASAASQRRLARGPRDGKEQKPQINSLALDRGAVRVDRGLTGSSSETTSESASESGLGTLSGNVTDSTALVAFLADTAESAAGLAAKAELTSEGGAVRLDVAWGGQRVLCAARRR